MNLNECWYKNRCTNKCSESCIRYNLMRSLFEQSNLPEAQWKYKDLVCNSDKDGDIGAFLTLKDIQLDITNFVKQGGNIYIWSKVCGNGKTSWAIRLMWAYFDKIWHKSNFDCKAVFVNVPNFLYNCKRNINVEVTGFEELCDKIRDCDLVVWDDISCDDFTKYEHQIIIQYIDERINAGRANIFTGNNNRDECMSILGERLTSRIFGFSEVIQFVEKDKRGIN